MFFIAFIDADRGITAENKYILQYTCIVSYNNFFYVKLNVKCR